MSDILVVSRPSRAALLSGGRGLVASRGVRPEEDENKFEHDSLKICRGSSTFKASQVSPPARATLAHATGYREHRRLRGAHTSLRRTRHFARSMSIELSNRSTTCTA
jgi:hypothetical protein